MTDNFVTSGFFCAAADGFVGSSVSGHIHTDIEIFPVDQYCRPTECRLFKQRTTYFHQSNLCLYPHHIRIIIGSIGGDLASLGAEFEGTEKIFQGPNFSNDLF